MGIAALNINQRGRWSVSWCIRLSGPFAVPFLGNLSLTGTLGGSKVAPIASAADTDVIDD